MVSEIRSTISLSTEGFPILFNQITGYSGADCGSGHIPSVANRKVKLSTLQRTKTDKKLKFDLLRIDNEYQKRYHQHI